MKIIVFLIVLIIAVAWAEPVSNNSNIMQQAIGSDLSLKMLMVDDGSPKGKCYCSCVLNSAPVFMEIDPSTMSGSEMIALH